jgi:uncharacterized membrane protein
MSQKKTALTTTQLAMTPIFIALVAVATMAFTVSIPATSGYFNIGETVIYTAAILFGPYVGAISGGVGAAISDIILAPAYWPGTLVIKAFEGAIVGFLGKRALKAGSKLQWKMFTFILGLITGVLLIAIGLLYYTGEVQLFLGMPQPSTATVTFTVPAGFWYSLGALIIVLTTYVGFKLEPEFGWLVFAIFLGGLEMVAGYFLYEQFAMGKAAIVEVPVNIGQMLIGLILAIPVAKAVWRALPTLKETQQ